MGTSSQRNAPARSGSNSAARWTPGSSTGGGASPRRPISEKPGSFGRVSSEAMTDCITSDSASNRSAARRLRWHTARARSGAGSSRCVGPAVHLRDLADALRPCSGSMSRRTRSVMRLIPSPATRTRVPPSCGRARTSQRHSSRARGCRSARCRRRTARRHRPVHSVFDEPVDRRAREALQELAGHRIERAEQRVLGRGVAHARSGWTYSRPGPRRRSRCEKLSMAMAIENAGCSQALRIIDQPIAHRPAVDAPTSAPA